MSDRPDPTLHTTIQQYRHRDMKQTVFASNGHGGGKTRDDHGGAAADDDDDDDDGYDDYDDDRGLVLGAWVLRESQAFGGRFVRSFSKAAAIYTGVRTFTAFMKNPFRKTIPAVWQGVMSKDCLRFAAFLGLYPSLYHLTVSTLRRYRKQQDGWTYGISGAVAGLSMSLEAPSRQKTLAFFVAARALGAGASTLVARGLVTSLPHAETLAFCACCCALVTVVALYPHLLPAGYYYSVLKWSRDYSHPVLERLFRQPGPRFLSCAEAGLHAGTCTGHAAQDFLRSLPAFAQLYLPIHLAPVLLFKRKTFKDRPTYVLKSLVKNLSRSTLFLSSMVAIAKYVICLLRNSLGGPPPLPVPVPALAGLLCGLSVLWERPGRRKELVLFLIPQMLNALRVMLKGKGQGRFDVPHAYVCLFALSSGVVLHAFERQPASLTQLITGVLRFFLGQPRHGRKKGEGKEGKVGPHRRIGRGEEEEEKKKGSLTECKAVGYDPEA